MGACDNWEKLGKGAEELVEIGRTEGVIGAEERDCSMNCCQRELEEAGATEMEAATEVWETGAGGGTEWDARVDANDGCDWGTGCNGGGERLGTWPAAWVYRRIFSDKESGDAAGMMIWEGIKGTEGTE